MLRKSPLPLLLVLMASCANSSTSDSPSLTFQGLPDTLCQNDLCVQYLNKNMGRFCDKENFFISWKGSNVMEVEGVSESDKDYCHVYSYGIGGQENSCTTQKFVPKGKERYDCVRIRLEDFRYLH